MVNAIGVRELKARLSACLREVAAGNVLLVTDRGRVVAEIRRPEEAPRDRAPRESGLQRLIRRGAVRPPIRKDRSWLEPTGVRLRKGTGQALLDAEREDG